MKTNLKSTLSFLFTLCAVTLASAQDLNTSLNSVWSKIQVGILFCILLAFVVGVVVVFNAKSSSNPDDFKKKLMGFIYGLIFLFASLGLVSLIKSFATTATNVSF